jgi:putative hydrolase of the HAD superfamily
MKKTIRTKALFLDIGGVLLTNGWDHKARELAARKFKLNLHEMNDRHRLTFDTYEVGKLSLKDYLGRVVFYRKRAFTMGQFRNFMFAQSKPYPEMIEMVRQLKMRYRLKIVVVSNEGRELTIHRIRKFRLDGFVDFFISSCFVHFRKPDVDIYKLALDVAQVRPAQIMYIEDRTMFVQVAESLGIPGIRHTDAKSTRSRLASFGLTDGS